MTHISYTLNIKDYREKFGLTQEELAACAGISQVYLSLLERGNKPLTKEAAEKITIALNVVKKKNEGPVFKPLSSNNVRAAHVASFSPEAIQGLVLILRSDIYIREKFLEHILEKGDVPTLEEFSIKHAVGDSWFDNEPLEKAVKAARNYLKETS